MSSCGLALAPPAKNVVVYRNGDPFFPGRKFVVNQRRFPTFEAFLNEVTESIRTPLAVRNLYTPRHGHRVAELGDLQEGCQYVAAGFEKFRKLNYLNRGKKELRGTRNAVQWKDLCSGVRWQFWNVLSYVKSLSSLGVADNKPQPAAGSLKAGQFPTVAPWKSNILARWQKHPRVSCTIQVFRNGDLLSPPFLLSLSTSTPLQWDTLLATLTSKADLRSGAVSKLCRLDGTQVSGEEELVNGHYYVAVGNEEYKKLPYFELLVPQDSAGRMLWNHPNSRRKKYRRRFGELCATSQVRAGDSALAEPPQQLDSRRVQTTGAVEKDKIPAALPHLQRQGGKSHLKESIFHAKPVRAGRNRRSSRNVQHWPDQEESVYKTRDPRKEMRGAQEVKEDERTRVDVPIDQRVAELISKDRMIHHSKAQTSDKSPKTGARKRDGSDSEDEKHPTMLPLAAKSSEEFTKGLRWEKRDD